MSGAVPIVKVKALIAGVICVFAGFRLEFVAGVCQSAGLPDSNRRCITMR